MAFAIRPAPTAQNALLAVATAIFPVRRRTDTMRHRAIKDRSDYSAKRNCSMKSARISLRLAAAALFCFCLAGCPHANQGEKPVTTKDDHGHEHHHHGPHNGHLMEIGGEEYHAEWTHDESGKVTFYILDSEAKKEVPVAADEITIDVK